MKKVYRARIRDLQLRTRARAQRPARAIIAMVPTAICTRIGVLLARTRPLDWYPGWKFAAGESDGGLRLRLRLLLWKHFEARRMERPFPIPWYDGLRVNVYLGNDLSRCLFVGGAYEPNEFMFLSQVLRPGMTVIDVGANDGLYTLFAARRVGLGRVLALEPSSREFARLEANLRLNGLANVRPLRLAAADGEGFATLSIAGYGHEGQNTLGGFAYAIEQQGTEQVMLATLDSVVREHTPERVDVIKIDAEGGEFAVLRGAHNTLATYRPLILLELLEVALHHQGASRQAVLDFLQKLGYRFWVFGSSGRPEPVPQVNVDGANIIAVHPARGVAGALSEV